MEIQSLKSGDHIEIRAFDANLDDRRKPPSGAIIVQGAVSSYDDEPGAVTYHLRGPDGEVISRVPTPPRHRVGRPGPGPADRGPEPLPQAVQLVTARVG
jgi:hypothetical protein